MVREGGQDSTVSESVALWGLSTGPHKGEEEAVESLVAEIRDVQGRRWDREECMMKREGERKVEILSTWERRSFIFLSC